jgi:hypothetical protein
VENRLHWVLDVTFHDLRPETGEPLGTLVSAADECADVVAALKQQFGGVATGLAGRPDHQKVAFHDDGSVPREVPV